MGKEALGLADPPTELAVRQACAAVGQSRLMTTYERAFGEFGLGVAQVLLTESDLDDRLRYLNLRSALLALLRCGCIPIINENDVVATAELAFREDEPRPVFGDNDRLSALIATKLQADLLVLLTDVDGLYDVDPRLDPGARLLPRIEPSDFAQAGAGASGVISALGRGGMRSKVEAAVVAARSGCQVVIASGLEPTNLGRILDGESVGTWFPPAGSLSARDRWLAFAAAPRGTLVIDEGAVRALRERGASLLAVGVRRIEGDFDPGDVVTLEGPAGELVGRGMIHCDRASAERWALGEHPGGTRNHHALVHRDHLVLEPQDLS